MSDALISRWWLYGIEAALLGCFMVSACVIVWLVEHPASPWRRRPRSTIARRVIVGLGMGMTAIALIYSPLGARSGAHMNPSVTLSFLLLGRIEWPDAAGYILAQCIGGLIGVGVATIVLRGGTRHESVGFVATMPGRRGAGAAWLAEFGISFGMMTAVVLAGGVTALRPYVGLLAGGLVATYITLEAPLSGMSMNPARTLASAVWSRSHRAWWVYWTAPPLAMALAALLWAPASDLELLCAKLHHPRHIRCVFCGEGGSASPAPDAGIQVTPQ